MRRNKVDLWSKFDFIIIHSLIVLLTLDYIWFLYDFWRSVSSTTIYIIFFDIEVFFSIRLKFILSWNFVVFIILKFFKNAFIISLPMLVFNWTRFGFNGFSINILFIWIFKWIIVCNLVLCHSTWWRIILLPFLWINKWTNLVLSLIDNTSKSWNISLVVSTITLVFFFLFNIHFFFVLNWLTFFHQSFV